MTQCETREKGTRRKFGATLAPLTGGVSTNAACEIGVGRKFRGFFFKVMRIFFGCGKQATRRIWEKFL